MPLNRKGEILGRLMRQGFRRAVGSTAFNCQQIARLCNALPVERVNFNGLCSQKACKLAVGCELNFVGRPILDFERIVLAFAMVKAGLEALVRRNFVDVGVQSPGRRQKAAWLGQRFGG